VEKVTECGNPVLGQQLPELLDGRGPLDSGCHRPCCRHGLSQGRARSDPRWSCGRPGVGGQWPDGDQGQEEHRTDGEQSTFHLISVLTSTPDGLIVGVMVAGQALSRKMHLPEEYDGSRGSRRVHFPVGEPSLG
jgi:hypothetical protein